MVGTGAAVFMEKSGLGPLEDAGVDLLPSGEVRVTAGATSLGQGVETVLATLAAEERRHDVERAAAERKGLQVARVGDVRGRNRQGASAALRAELDHPCQELSVVGDLGIQHLVQVDREVAQLTLVP
jgi:hypothetical protein